MRRLARDQWVRLHGTPRVTVLVGVEARTAFLEWLKLGQLDGQLHDGDELDQTIKIACARVSELPTAIVAISTTRDQLDAWRRDRHDRLAAMVDEGVIELAAPKGWDGSKAAMRGVFSTSDANFDARSAAEAALFEALEATPATAGRFRLNEYLSVRFGPTACEVDLLARMDRIAIEIDGFHHFTDMDRYRRDRRKDLLLQLQGLTVIRVLAEDALADPRDAVQQVCEVLAHRRGAT